MAAAAPRNGVARRDERRWRRIALARCCAKIAAAARRSQWLAYRNHVMAALNGVILAISLSAQLA
jgi:hypothetical protein